jgi:hypothetical protein
MNQLHLNGNQIVGTWHAFTTMTSNPMHLHGLNAWETAAYNKAEGKSAKERKGVKTMLGIKIQYHDLTVEVSWPMVASIVLIVIRLIFGNQGLNW